MTATLADGLMAELPCILSMFLMNESEFHRLSDDMLTRLYDALEAADESGALEAECASGVLTLQLPSGEQYIVSKHTASRQIWLSSPLSGGLHFSYDGAWKLQDGRTLEEILTAELATFGIEATA